MSASDSGRFGFEFTFSSKGVSGRRDPGAPFRLIVLADFSGRAQRGQLAPFATRRVIGVDCDSFENVFAGFGAALHLGFGNTAARDVPLRFESLEDFHPDHLLKQIPQMTEFLSARRLLQSPATASQGAEKLMALLGTAATLPPSDSPAPAARPAGPSESNETTLARLLGSTPVSAKSSANKPGASLDIQAMFRQIVGASNAAPAAPAGAAGLLGAVDMELSSRLRTLLHHPAFQSLEAGWRSLDFLVRRLPDDEGLRLFVLDASLDELPADLDGLHRLLRDTSPTLIVGNYTFGTSEADLNTLAGLGKLCASLKSTFLAGAHPHLVGCDNFALHPDPDDWRQPLSEAVKRTWQSLRTSAEAERIALSLPRFLIRQPYGSRSDPIESFGFEEIPAPHDHEDFLWGNPAFLITYLLADNFVSGARETDSAVGVIGELPVFQFADEGEAAMKPCAEAWLSDRAANVILQHGLMPCLSIKGRDAVRVSATPSISTPAKPLSLFG